MRLIDADVRINDLQNELKAGYMGCEKADYFEKLIQDYKDQPVIDAEPIIHRHWRKVNPMVDTVECSGCGYQLLSEELETPYCAWCGAEMDEKDEVSEDEKSS